MVFYKHNKLVPEFRFRMNTCSSLLERVDEFCFLGLNLDTHLDWSSHIRKVSGKLNRAIGVMNRLRYTLPRRVMILLYNSFILSHINYCILTWG